MGRVVCCKAAGYGSNLEDGFPRFAGLRPLQMICGEFPKSFSNAMSLLDDLVSTKRTSVLQMVRRILKVMEQFVAEHANSFRVSGHFVRRDLRLASSLTHVPGKHMDNQTKKVSITNRPKFVSKTISASCSFWCTSLTNPCKSMQANLIKWI